MSLLLLFAAPFQIVQGAASGGDAEQTGVAFGAFASAPEVIVLVLPIQTVVELILPIGENAPPVVPMLVPA